MDWTIPGTVLKGPREDVESSIRQIEGMFLAGGMVRSQVAAATGLEAHAVQNWVKRGFLSNPVGKRYSLRQFSRIAIINMLKSVMSMEKICGLLSYINGALDDESDDIIDDAQLYFIFVRLAARARTMDSREDWDDLIDDTLLYFMFLRLASQARHIGGTRSWDEVIPEILAPYHEPVPGAKERFDRVLRIMLTAWIAARTMQQAEKMLSELF